MRVMDFANYEEQKVLLALYCINKNNECTKECDAGDCLCLDEEQLALLDQCLGTQIICESEDGKAGFFKVEKYNDGLSICLEKQAGSKQLIKNLNMESKEIQSAISTTTGKVEEEAWQEVLCGLPLLQMINIRCELSCRDSIAYWCLFGEDSEEFMRKLLKAFCVCAIARNLKGLDVKCVTDYMESIFNKIDELYEEQEFSKCCQKFKQSIVQYEEKFREENASLQIGYHSLRELYKNISGVQHERSRNPKVITYIMGNNESSMNEIVQLYRLVEKIFALFGETLGKATKSFWNVKLEDETTHSDYSKFQEVLGNIENKDASTQKTILRQFVLLITDVVECSTENVETFYKSFL